MAVGGRNLARLCEKFDIPEITISRAKQASANSQGLTQACAPVLVHREKADSKPDAGADDYVGWKVGTKDHAACHHDAKQRKAERGQLWVESDKNRGQRASGRSVARRHGPKVRRYVATELP